MEIKLKSNRKHIINFASFFGVIFGVLLVYMIIGSISNFFDISSDLSSFVIVLIIFVFLLLAIIFAKYYKGKTFIFSTEAVQIYNKGILLKEIKTEGVESMHYYPWRVHYILTIFLGTLNEGGAWKIHILEKCGTRHEIGFLSEKEAIILQEKLYPNTLEIIYDKRKKN